MSLPRDTERDPRADVLLSSVLRAADGAEVGGCPDAEVIGLFAEQALAGAELRAVEAHVEGCPRCQATVAAFVRALPEEAGAADVAAARADGRGTSAGGGFAAWFAGWRWLVPATSLAAVALVAVWIGRGQADDAAELAPGPAAVSSDAGAPAAAPEASRAAPPRAEAFVPDAGASRSGMAKAATTEPRAESAESPAALEARRAVAGTPVARDAAANAATGAGAARGTMREAAAADVVASTADIRPSPAAQEALTVIEAPPAPAAPAAARAKSATFSALAFTPWRVADGRVERSRDNGATWEPVATPEGVRVLAAASPGGDLCWLVVDDGVLRTTNGRTWTRTTRPTSEPLSGIVAASAERASVFSATGRRWETTDAGRTWAPVP